MTREKIYFMRKKKSIILLTLQGTNESPIVTEKQTLRGHLTTQRGVCVMGAHNRMQGSTNKKHEQRKEWDMH